MSIYSNYSEEDFEQWIFSMDDKVEDFLDSLHGEIKNSFDYSAESLNAAENWLRSKYKSAEDLDKMHRAIIIDGFVRYIGEVVRKYSGGFWDMDCTSDKNKNEGPFIVSDVNSSYTFYPYLEMKNIFLENQDHVLLHKLLERIHEQKNFE